MLYGKRELLAAMPPFFGGGGMIASVEDDSFVPADPPQRCEAGTPPIGQAIGLGAALEWLSTLPWEDRLTHEQKLYTVALNALQRIEGLQLVGPTSPETCSSCLSFTLEGVHPHDLTDLLGQEGICLRAGHHCAQPLHRALGLMATTRLSFGIFTTEEEITEAAKAIERLAQTLRT